MASKRPLFSMPSNPLETVEEIDDLLMLILLFLPARPLNRFQLVCKRWRSIISDERFSRLHTIHHRRLPAHSQISFILLANLPAFFHFNHLERTFHHFSVGYSHTKILQSCNGLLLLECRNTTFGLKKYYVFNPTNKNIRNLVVENKKKYLISGLCLAFDPLKSPHYKVICVRRKEDSLFEYTVEVYDSKNHTWTNLGLPFPCLNNTQFYNVIYRNSGIYWIKPHARSCFLDLEKGTVETLPTIRFPRRRTGESQKNYVLESNGHIHCISLCLHSKTKSVLVFELLDDISIWVPTFRANLNPMSAAFPDMNAVEINVLGIVRGEDSVLLLHFNNQIVSYKLRDGEFELVLDLGTRGLGRDYRFHFDRNHVFQLVETLVPV